MDIGKRIALRFLNAQSKQFVLMKFLSQIAKGLGAAKHIYVVGGAVRNFVLGVPIKDIDVVVDSLALGSGRDSEWFARAVARQIPARTSLVTNTYGVAILSVSGTWMLDGLDMDGEVIEIANARKESYSGAEGKGKGYKPTDVQPATIEEDVFRREFTFNTLLWRLLDLTDGPEQAEIIDLTGRGRKDLEEGMLRTPVDPDKTFGDDPTRMLRAIKFVAKYNFKVPPDVVASIRRNAPKLKRMPWDAVRKLLVGDILEGPAPRKSLVLLQSLGLLDTLKEMCEETPPFASALSRALSDHAAEVLLDMMDLGFAVKTPLSFLSEEGRKKLRELILALPESEGVALFEAIKKPPLPDQEGIFTRYNIPPKERKQVWDVARKLMFDDPSLALEPRKLQEATEAIVARQA